MYVRYTLETCKFLLFFLLFSVLAPSAFGQAVAQKTLSQLSGQFNVRDYGAKGNGQVYSSGWTTTAGSNQVTAPRTLTAADVGKRICVQGAGGFNSYAVTAITSNNPLTLSISWTTAPVGTGVGSQIYVSGLGGMTPSSGVYYVKTQTVTSGTTANIVLYTDSHLLVPATVTGTYTAGGAATNTCALDDTIASVSGTTATLTAKTAVQSMSSVAGAIGTDDTTAIAAAVTAASANGGTVYFPAGVYPVDGGVNAAGVAVTASNVEILGAGMGVSSLIRMSDIGQVVIVNAATSNISNITVKDLSVSFPVTPTQRFGIASHGIITYGSSTYSVSNVTINNVNCTSTNIGIQFRDNVSDSTCVNSWVSNTLADGIATYGVTTPCARVTMAYNHVSNTGDDALSDNSNNTCSGANTGITFVGNQVYNSGAGGIATCGSDRCEIIGNNIRRTFLSGIRVQGGSNFYNVTTTNITGNNISEYGLGTAGQGATGMPAGVIVEADGQTYAISGGFNGVGTSNNLTIVGNTIGSGGQGPHIAILTPGGTNTNAISNHLIASNTLLGPQIAISGSYHYVQSGTNNASIYINNGSNATIQGNQILSSYGEAILLGQYCIGAAVIDQNVITSPNTSAGTGYYAIDVQGAQAPYVGNNPASGLPSGTGSWSINPQQTASIITLGSGYTAGTALVGLTSTGSNPQTWTRPTGGGAAASTHTSSPFISFTTNGAVILPTGNRNQDVIVAMGTTSLPVNQQIFIMLANDSTNNNCYGVDLYSGNIVNLVNGTITSTYGYGQLGSSAFSVTASDTIEAILSGNTINVWCTRSGTRYLIDSAVVPNIYTGPYAGLWDASASGTPGINSFSVR